MELIEREAQLASLGESLADAANGRGSMVFVSGEAGIGKSSLVRAFCASRPAGVDVYSGYCDALGTPRALGPVHDIARTAGGELGRLLATDAERHAIFTAFLDLLSAGRSVVVIEDAHWADEATLDLLLYVGRRVSDTPATVIVTYRDDEIGRDHPLRRVLGDLATTRSVRRLPVPGLSRAAVTALAEPLHLDVDRLYEVTAGNPFFVTEALSAPAQSVPATVRDAVLAKARRLGPQARAVLDTVAMVPDRVDAALLRAVGVADGPAAAALDDCLQAAMLVVDEHSVRFRHELARLAVEQQVPSARRVELHRLILDHLAGTANADPARLSYHAEAANDSDAVLRYAPVAAVRASKLGARREAAAQYARAIRHASAAPVELQAAFWDQRAIECGYATLADEATASAAEAIRLWRSVGDGARAAAVTARYSGWLWLAGRAVEAHNAAHSAIAELEGYPPGPAHAAGYTYLAHLLMLARDIDGAIANGTLAVEYARRFGDVSLLARALNALGSAQWFSEPDRAAETLAASLAAARESEDDAAVAGTMCNLGSGAGEIRRYPLADHWLAETIAWSAERDLDFYYAYTRAWLARSLFEQGRWDEATTLAAKVLDSPRDVASNIVALTVVGRLRVRRGDPGAAAPLEEAWSFAEQTGDLQRLWPAAAARAEAAWLAGTPESIEALIGEVYEQAVQRRHDWAAGELAYWLGVGGVTVTPSVAARPYALQLAGEPAEAARAWREVGCPYEAAIALADSDDEAHLLEALAELHRMGAWPAAEVVSRRLREYGVRRLPRAPRRTTRDNPAQLTARELEVLQLLPAGLRNVDIAAQLHISPKTVDHHVSAILTKLGVGTRQEAAQWARAQLVAKDGEPAAGM